MVGVWGDPWGSAWGRYRSPVVAAGRIFAAPQTTKATGGSAIVADTPWSITPDQNASAVDGDVLELQLTKFNSAPDWTRLFVIVHVRNTQ